VNEYYIRQEIDRLRAAYPFPWVAVGNHLCAADGRPIHFPDVCGLLTHVSDIESLLDDAAAADDLEELRFEQDELNAEVLRLEKETERLEDREYDLLQKVADCEQEITDLQRRVADLENA